MVPLCSLIRNKYFVEYVRMKIVTLNTWGKYGPYEKRWQFLVQELISTKPDIICLQEVEEPELLEKIEQAASLPFSIASYEAGLTISTHFPIFFEHIVNYKTISPNEEKDRKAVIVGLEVEKKRIIVANTHLSWKTEDTEIRYQQVRELIHAVKQTGEQGILTGDFNDTPESKTIREIKKAGYIDLYASLNPSKREITWDNQNPFIQTHSVKFPDRRIDFLFLHESLANTLAPEKCEIIFRRPGPNGIYPSDHYGVCAEIRKTARSSSG